MLEAHNYFSELLLLPLKSPSKVDELKEIAHSPSLSLILKEASWEGIILSTSFAHLVTSSRGSIAYLAERV